MDRFPKKVVIAGACMLGLTLALGWGGVNMVIKGQMKKEIRIINNTDTYRAWKDFPIPLYLSVFFFNITNAAEIETGAKPKLQEVGPYVYMERLRKTDLSSNATTEIISFRQLRYYYFQPDMSSGTEEDLVTIPNVPLLGLAKLAQNLKERDDMLATLSDLISKKVETLTKTQTVKEFLFEGFPVNNYASLVKDTNGDPELEQDDPFKLPVCFNEEKFGFFKNRNGTGWDGMFEIHNGRNYTWEFGQIVTFNEETEVPWWNGPCGHVYGSDGLSFHPFINTTTPLYTFEPVYCRMHTYKFATTENVQGVDSLRFVIAPETFQGPHKYPQNACYCPVENSTNCNRNGVYDLEPCYDGLPLLLSKPHFLDADPEIIQGVEGLNPNPEMHESFMNMHAMSGIPLKNAKRFQFNIEMMKYPGLTSLGEITRTIVPIYWYQESVEAGSIHFLVFKIIAGIQNGWNMLKYGFVGGGLIILIAGLMMGLLRKTVDSDKVQLVK